MERIEELLTGDIKTVAIAGHKNPDGDCIGSCMAMYLYLREQYPQIETDIYLGETRPVFGHLERLSDVRHWAEPEKVYDLLLLFDVSSEDRIAVAEAYLGTAGHTACVDHHITNSGFAEVNRIEPEASSACEVLYGLLDPEKITPPVAAALYTGIVHDTGVFQYANTSGHTMRIAGHLMDIGVPHTRIIEDSFYKKTYAQNRILGETVMRSRLQLDGQVITAVTGREDLKRYGVQVKDLDGIVSQLRLTEGVEAAVYLYQLEDGQFKISMRSNGNVDVSAVASLYGGGGHKMAAGCSRNGDPEKIIDEILEQVRRQLSPRNG